ncbi:MAG: hypothetical protein OEW19_12680, partial [Acidobacteriota bacterium]|nr:hypothetical protein [Acidobacteriota bacterium]
AAQADVPLLVVMGPLCPARELVGALLEALDVDPLFGMAVPRVAAATGTGRVLSAPGWDTPEVTLPLRVLAHEPEYRVLADVTAPVMLFRRELIGSLAYEAGAWRSVRGAVADFTVRARRAGFRAVLCNRALVEPVVPAPAPAPTGLDPHDRSAIHRAYPELDRANAALVGPELRSAERPLAAAFDAPDSLLLDARNLVPFYNGTSAAILGMADAIHRVRPGSEVSLWLQEDVAAWHELAGRYPGWRLHHTGPPPPHAAAIRLSQPWHLSEVESLAEAAAVNVYWMLDTIAWDIVYTAPCGLDHVWTRVAAEADALLFISEFSRRRFENRFGEGTDLHTGVCRLSLVPDDYLTVAAADRPEGPYWLVVGNQYDHKHIGPTVDLLTRSFPRQRLVVFGDRHQVRTPQVTRFDSGPVEEAIVQGCFAGADLVVFPSFYEGFGLPMVQGLSRGRTVVVRASQLVDELAARYRGPGRLVTFTTDRELVDVLNRLTRGDVPESVPLGTAPSAGQWTWDAAARTMLALTRQLVGACPSARMRRRTGMAGHGLLHPLRRQALTATDVEPATPHP